MPDIDSEKSELRERLRFRRRHAVAGMSPIDAAVAFRALPSPLTERCTPGTLIAGYAAIGDEAPADALLSAARAAGCRTALPWHGDRAGPMQFRLWDGTLDALEPGPFGSLQPRGDAAAVAPDIALCPLVGFDRRGGRLGQGGGHYDRALADHPALYAVGVAWAVQEVDAVPMAAHDRRLQAILTEQEWIEVTS